MQQVYLMTQRNKQYPTQDDFLGFEKKRDFSQTRPLQTPPFTISKIAQTQRFRRFFLANFLCRLNR